jgi:L-threonylcarbamoyladenylate synthase
VKTEVVLANAPSPVSEAVAARLRNGEVVALPTETVYGLAADALNGEAVAKIFETKERPRFDPLIIHLPDRDWLERVTDIPTQDRELVLKLTDRFWPGPFTIVLPRRAIVPDIVTAGLDSVAVRISAHPVFGAIIRAFGAPLAAPSANRFGRISPTDGRHVLDELDGRIPLLVDAGPTQHGIESTIVRIRDGVINVLRRGPVTEEQLSSFGAKIENAETPGSISAPGQLPSHYAPKTPVQLIEDANSYSPKQNQRCALLAWNAGRDRKEKFVAVRQLSERQDLREAAANLFRCLRELDVLEADLIVAERVPDRGLGAAITDRLRRASHRPIDAPDTPR